MLAQLSLTRTNPGKTKQGRKPVDQTLCAICADPLAGSLVDWRPRMRTRKPIAVRYGALSVAGWMLGACRNYLAGNLRLSADNRSFNGMAGESVALNPALRERNRNLKGCGLTGLLFWVGIAPATLRSKNSRQSPRWGCAGASSEGGKGFREKRSGVFCRIAGQQLIPTH